MEPMETNNYFQSYEDLEIHNLMLKDLPRNQAYKQALHDNKTAIEGRIVLDVGAGTGFLSIICAQLGAKKVYAVEASNVYQLAEETVKENKQEHIVKVIHSRVEDVELPEKVDVIVSEWMGFYLFHEAMFNSVIAARDKFLKPGGMMFPEFATLYAAPCSVPSMYNFYDDVSGVSMRGFAEKLRGKSQDKPLTITVSPQDILSEPDVVAWMDLREATVDDFKSLKAQHLVVVNKPGKYQGICLWFTVNFPSSMTEPVMLSTEPEAEETHWKQTVVVLPSEAKVEMGEPIAYELSLNASEENSRWYKMEVTMLDAESVEHPEYCTCHLTKCILVRAVLDKYEKDSLSTK